MRSNITKDNALSKAMVYCAYRERSSLELVERLKKWGVNKKDISEILHKLKAERFIDDIRYTKAFVSGKFRIKKWGRIKISSVLRAKGIDNETILIGLNEISEELYFECLKKLTEDKINTVKGEPYIVQNKVALYLQRKGYESGLIWKSIKELIDQKFI